MLVPKYDLKRSKTGSNMVYEKLKIGPNMERKGHKKVLKWSKYGLQRF